MDEVIFVELELLPGIGEYRLKRENEALKDKLAISHCRNDIYERKIAKLKKERDEAVKEKLRLHNELVIERIRAREREEYLSAYIDLYIQSEREKREKEKLTALREGRKEIYIKAIKNCADRNG